MTTTTAPNDLVRGLRYRRWLGRQQLVRGVTPSRPRIKYGLAPGCLAVVLVIVTIYVVMLVALAIQMALYVVVALAALLVVRPFSRFALPALRGGVFNGNAFAERPAAGMFVLGAVPTTALVYPLSHGLVTLAGAAVVGGLGFRALVRALDGKPLLTLPLRKDLDATPSVGPDLSEPGDFGLWIGEATGTLSALGHTAGLQRGSNVTLNLRDAANNTAIFGETGTGKTTRVINHLLVQALDFDCGLIFDVRGDFHTTAAHAAQDRQDDPTRRGRAARAQPTRRPHAQHRRRVPRSRLQAARAGRGRLGLLAFACGRALASGTGRPLRRPRRVLAQGALQLRFRRARPQGRDRDGQRRAPRAPGACRRRRSRRKPRCAAAQERDRVRGDDRRAVHRERTQRRQPDDRDRARALR